MKDLIKHYFPDVTDRQLDQLDALTRLYPDWNAKINVISRKDIDNIVVNHILPSLAIARFMTPVDGSAILDLGTGGGFPGIPLAIMWPQCHFLLIDRIGKKIKVASSIAEAVGLTNVNFQHGDIGECHQKFDFVVSRAVMRLDELVPLIKKNISPVCRNQYPNGLVCLKGGDLTDEIADTRRAVLEIALSDYFREPFFETKSLVYVPMAIKSK